MANYKQSLPYNTPAILLKPEYEQRKGSPKKRYKDPKDGELLYIKFKTYGGTEREVNGILVIEDTASVETWYRPDIQADCILFLPLTKKYYEIIGKPENINMENKIIKMKVKGMEGGG